MVADLIDDFRTTTEKNSCVDPYTASISGNLLKKLNDAESTVDSHTFWFLILMLLAGVELAILATVYAKETFYLE